MASSPGFQIALKRLKSMPFQDFTVLILRSQKILAMEKKIEDNRKAKAWVTYVEHKILKGHSKEQAQAMANEVIYNQKPV